MTTRNLPTPTEVEAWSRTIEVPESLMGDKVTAVKAIYASMVKRLRRQPQMWWRQTLNVVGGCVRYAAAFIVGMPAVYVLARLLPEVSGHGPALPVPPGWTADAEPSLWIAGVLIGVLLVVTDVLVLDGHVGGFRNVFKERAAYLAGFVWAQKRYGLVVYV